jgi:hypothetical protein
VEPDAARDVAGDRCDRVLAIDLAAIGDRRLDPRIAIAATSDQSLEQQVVRDPRRPGFEIVERQAVINDPTRDRRQTSRCPTDAVGTEASPR